MKKLKKIVLLTIVILAWIRFDFYPTYPKNKIDNFYAQLEDVILNRMVELKNDFEKKGSLEGKIIYLDDIRSVSHYENIKTTYWWESDRKEVIIKVYDIMVDLKNNSGYKIGSYMMNNNQSDEEYIYLQNNESILSVFTNGYSFDRYNADSQLIDESFDISDTIKFKYKNKYIEMPIEMRLSVTINIDEKSIKEVIVNDITTSIDKYNKILEHEIKSILGQNKFEKYSQSINISLKNNLDIDGKLKNTKNFVDFLIYKIY